MENLKESGKSIFIVLLFGGGLIPATIAANSAMMDTLTNKRPEKKEITAEQKKTYLDPTFGAADYIDASDAGGPVLAVSPLLFAPEDVRVADVCAVLGRIGDVNDVADWKNLPSTRLPGAVNPSNPPMWLPRATFKANVRKNAFKGWPTDSKGEPLGGEELKKSELKRVSGKKAIIPDAALDAVFDTWAWGANIATPDKVARQIAYFRGGDGGTASTVVEWRLNLAAASGRAITVLAALTFITLQAVAYGALFIGPALRVFFDLDIGFGEMGRCDPELCTRIFQ